MTDPGMLEGFDPESHGDGFSGVIVVRHGSEVVFAEAYGWATPRWRVPNTVDTRFDTASITKLFTAVAVLQQVGRGALDLDASIHDYVDLASTTISREVTLRQLLTHTSGIADDADEGMGESYADLFVDRPCYAVMETSDFLPQFARKPPRAAPGSEPRYCNVGFVLAGLALEQVSGQSYRAYVEQEIFTRAGMDRSGFFDRRDAEPEVAEGWDRDGDGWVANVFSYPPIGSPDGGAHSTARDLVRFLDAVRGGELLDPVWTQAFFEPQVWAPDGHGYGFGLEYRGDTFYKEGHNAGVSAILTHYGSSEVDAVVLSNTSDDAWPVVAELNRRLEA